MQIVEEREFSIRDLTKRNSSAVVVFGLFLCLLTPYTQAQITAAVTGTVKDKSATPILDVEMILQNANTGVCRVSGCGKKEVSCWRTHPKIAIVPGTSS